MSFHTYAFRLGRDAALLDEDEWNEIKPLLDNRLNRVKAYRQQHKCSLEQALQEDPAGQAALDKYEKVTGIKLEHPDQLWGLRMQDYGALCPNCARPFRTPKAKFCAECGFALPAGTHAGKLRAP